MSPKTHERMARPGRPRIKRCAVPMLPKSRDRDQYLVRSYRSPRETEGERGVPDRVLGASPEFFPGVGMNETRLR